MFLSRVGGRVSRGWGGGGGGGGNPEEGRTLGGDSRKVHLPTDLLTVWKKRATKTARST